MSKILPTIIGLGVVGVSAFAGGTYLANEHKNQEIGQITEENQTKVDSLTEENNTIKIELTGAKNEIADKLAENEKLKNDIVLLTNEKTSLQNTLNEKLTLIEELESSTQAKDETINNLKSEVEVLQNQINDIDGTITTLTNRVNYLENRIEFLNNYLLANNQNLVDVSEYNLTSIESILSVNNATFYKGSDNKLYLYNKLNNEFKLICDNYEITNRKIETDKGIIFSSSNTNCLGVYYYKFDDNSFTLIDNYENDYSIINSVENDNYICFTSKSSVTNKYTLTIFDKINQDFNTILNNENSISVKLQNEYGFLIYLNSENNGKYVFFNTDFSNSVIITNYEQNFVDYIEKDSNLLVINNNNIVLFDYLNFSKSVIDTTDVTNGKDITGLAYKDETLAIFRTSSDYYKLDLTSNTIYKVTKSEGSDTLPNYYDSYYKLDENTLIMYHEDSYYNGYVMDLQNNSYCSINNKFDKPFYETDTLIYFSISSNYKGVYTFNKSTYEVEKISDVGYDYVFLGDYNGKFYVRHSGSAKVYEVNDFTNFSLNEISFLATSFITIDDDYIFALRNSSIKIYNKTDNTYSSISGSYYNVEFEKKENGLYYFKAKTSTSDTYSGYYVFSPTISNTKLYCIYNSQSYGETTTTTYTIGNYTIFYTTADDYSAISTYNLSDMTSPFSNYTNFVKTNGFSIGSNFIYFSGSTGRLCYIYENDKFVSKSSSMYYLNDKVYYFNSGVGISILNSTEQINLTEESATYSSIILFDNYIYYTSELNGQTTYKLLDTTNNTITETNVDYSELRSFYKLENNYLVYSLYSSNNYINGIFLFNSDTKQFTQLTNSGYNFVIKESNNLVILTCSEYIYTFDKTTNSGKITNYVF